MSCAPGVDQQPQIIACLITNIGVIVENDLKAELNESPDEHWIKNGLQPGHIVIVKTFFLDACRQKHARRYEE